MDNKIVPGDVSEWMASMARKSHAKLPADHYSRMAKARWDKTKSEREAKRLKGRSHA